MSVGYHVLALDNTNKLWSWGLNTSGQLGVQDYDDRSSPVLVVGNITFNQMDVGEDFSCALQSGARRWAGATSRACASASRAGCCSTCSRT